MSDIEIVNMDIDEERSTMEASQATSTRADINISDMVISDDSEIIIINSDDDSRNIQEINTTRQTTTLTTEVYTIAPSTAVIEQEGSSTLVQTDISVISVVSSTDLKDSPEDFKGKEKRPTTSKQKESPTKDDEGECCPICFEPWSNSGAHRLSSLHCGHLFGRSCIARWLQTKGRSKCPQCNAPAKRKHIRNIYAKSIKAIDTYERDTALEELEKEKLARKKAEESEAKMILQFQLARAECERMKTELERQQTLVMEQAQQSKPSSSGSSSSQLSLHTDHKYVIQTSFQITQSGARVMAFDSHSGTLVVSKPSPNQLFPGYGVLKVSSFDNKHSQFVSIHEKPIRDAVFSNQNDGLLLTASVDKTLKITSIQTNSTVLSYSTPAPVWSCVWNTSDVNYVYGGLQNGQCCVFDTRNTRTHLKILKQEEAGGCPLVSIAFVPKDVNSLFKPCGLLTCSLQGGCFWENTADTDYIPQSLHFPEGSCTCLRFEPTTRHCLLSQRPSRNCRSRHAIIQLHGNGLYQSLSRNQEEQDHSDGSLLCSGQVISQCYGGLSQKLLGHSTLFTSPDDDTKLIAAAGDEATKSVILWDGSNGRQLQSLQHPGTVVDVCAFQTNNSSFLTTITEQQMSFYKWK